MKHVLSIFLTSLFLCFSAQAKVITQEITYQADVTLKGFLAYDDSTTEKRPGILVVHEWWGHNEYTRSRAIKLAELGYVAFAVDMYGDGKNTDHPKNAGEWMESVFKNFDLGVKRFQAAQKFLQDFEKTDKAQIAAIGYCFGGATVLNLARQGADLKAVVSFHGGLTAIKPAIPGNIKAKVAVFHAGSDKMISEDDVKKFKEEMTLAKADLKFVSYPQAQHAFTNPKATEMGKKYNLPLAYDAQADADSWTQMQNFFKEVFQKK